MNERIRELVKQAGDYVNEVYTPPVRSKTPDKIWEDGHIGWNEQFNEKFAELIVQECLEQIDKIRDGCEADKEYQQALGADWAGLAVARHFGVK